MGFGRFGPEELRGAISRTVRWRWPGERLLLTVPCEAEWALIHDEWSPDLWTDGQDLQVVSEHGSEPGALGVTERRLVYRALERHGLAFRIAAWTFAGLAVVGFLVQEPTMTPVAAALALVAWVVSRIVETLGFGSGSIELGRVLEVDDSARRIHGVDRWGVHYRLRLTEPDFRQVAPLLGR